GVRPGRAAQTLLARRRLPGDGLVAGLPEVAPAAAQARTAQGRGSAGRGDRHAAGVPAGQARRHAQRRRRAEDPRPTRPRRLRARRSGGDQGDPVGPHRRRPLHPDERLHRPADQGSQPHLHAPGADRLSAGGCARAPAQAAAGPRPLDAACRRRAVRAGGSWPKPGELCRLDALRQPGAGQGRRAGSPPAGSLRRHLPALEIATGPMSDLADTEREVEALLFAAAGPLSEADLAKRLPEGADIAAAIAALQARYAGRGVELACVAERWRFQTAQDLAWLMTDEREEPRRLSKAAQETLAIIAYHQPVTRAEIEAARGVQASRGTLDVLLELGLVRMRGRRRTPGRPVTYGTTDAFLEHFGLAGLADLPGAAEMKAAGLLSLDLPADFSVPDPMAASADEDPLEATDAPE